MNLIGELRECVAYAPCARVIVEMRAADEIETLRKSLSLIRGAYLRVVVRSMPDTVHIGRQAWVEAFEPLIVPPYNRLKWEQDEPSGEQ